MLVIHVHVHVKPEHLQAFIAETRKNSDASLQEPGIARFDLVQQADDPSRFVLIEAYKTSDAPAAHKETAHYAAWRDAVAPMMASPRTSVKFQSLCPDDARWSTPPR
jgi:autoinducer 2-degrading protein